MYFYVFFSIIKISYLLISKYNYGYNVFIFFIYFYVICQVVLTKLQAETVIGIDSQKNLAKENKDNPTPVVEKKEKKPNETKPKQPKPPNCLIEEDQRLCNSWLGSLNGGAQLWYNNLLCWVTTCGKSAASNL